MDALNSELVLRDIHAVPAEMFMLPVSSFSTSSCVSSVSAFFLPMPLVQPKKNKRQ